MKEKKITLRQALSLTESSLARAGIEGAVTEAEWILEEILGLKRFELYLEAGRRLTQEERERLGDIIRRRVRREPLAHILGAVDFRGQRIGVSGDVLIPRPETEVLVEEALGVLKKEGGPWLVLEPCTGSGCVSVALGAEYGDIRIIALDISMAALDIAQKNARACGVKEKIDFLRADINCPPLKERPVFDMIISNPPYVPSGVIGGLAPEVRDYEPAIALDGGPTGLDCVKGIIRVSAALLRPGGHLLLEFGVGQGNEIMEFSKRTQAFESIEIKKDLSGMERILVARRKTL